jgi:fatty acid desaturase
MPIRIETATGFRPMPERDTTTTRAPGEWQTVALIVVVLSLYAAILVSHRWVPWPITVGLLGFVTAWHGSVQHELVHGHLAGRPLATAVAWLPVSLWVPFDAYRRSHLHHHRDDMLTDPFDDPESWYVDARPDARPWGSRRGLTRAVLWFNRTFCGRMLIGPILGIGGFLRSDLAKAVRGDDGARRRWLIHLPLAAVLLVVLSRFGFPLWQYTAGAAYVGTSITMIRSFAEHRWTPDGQSRTAMVRSNRFWGTLFLNNNLHVAHHAKPGTPWYRLPQVADQVHADDIAAAGAGLYRGYGEVIRRYFLRPFCQPAYPPQAGLLVVPKALTSRGGARS